MGAKTYTFDEETHTHRIGGQKVPGITTVIDPLYDWSGIPKHILEAAKQYGSAVHKVVELYCTDSLDVEVLDPSLRPVLTAFPQWLKDYGFNKSDFIVELPMGDPALRYAGIPDLILDGKLIVEIKSRAFNQLSDPLQLVAQENLWIKNSGARTKYEHRVLEIRQDGSYKYTKANDKQSWPRFRKLLDFYWDKRMIESWKTA